MAVLHPHTSCVGRVLVFSEPLSLKTWSLSTLVKRLKFMHKWQPGIAHQNFLPTCVQILTDKSCFITDKNYIFSIESYSGATDGTSIWLTFSSSSLLSLNYTVSWHAVKFPNQLNFHEKPNTKLQFSYHTWNSSHFLYSFVSFVFFERFMWWLYWFMMMLIVK